MKPDPSGDLISRILGAHSSADPRTLVGVLALIKITLEFLKRERDASEMIPRVIAHAIPVFVSLVGPALPSGSTPSARRKEALSAHLTIMQDIDALARACDHTLRTLQERRETALQIAAAARRL